MSRASLLPVHCPTISYTPPPPKMNHFRIPLNLSCPCRFSLPVSFRNVYHLAVSLEFNYHPYKLLQFHPLICLFYFPVTIYDSIISNTLQYPFYLHSWTMVSLKLHSPEWLKVAVMTVKSNSLLYNPSPSTPILYRNLCWRMVHNCSWCRSLLFFLCFVLSSSCDTHYTMTTNQFVVESLAAVKKPGGDTLPLEEYFVSAWVLWIQCGL